MTETPVRFHSLSFVPEPNEAEVLVGRPDSESFAVFGADDAALLRRMAEGAHPDEAAEWYESTYGQPVDMADFLITLAELGFVCGDGEEVATARPVGLRWLGRAMFSPVAFGCLVLVLAGWVLAMVDHPDLAPRPGQVFFTRSLLVVQLAILFGQLPWIGLHEAGHVLAGRRLGLSSRLGVGTRLYFVVFETRMNGLLTVARRKRYLPILAGMAVDLFVIGGLGLLAFAVRRPGGGEPLIGGIALAMAFPIEVRLLYQFLLFLQTDVYFVIATALGCHDLHAAARAMIHNRLWGLLRRPGRLVDVDQWTERDQRVARWYAPIFGVGAVVMVVIGVIVVTPIVVRVVHLVGQSLPLGPTDARFWDSLLFSALNLAQFFFFGLVAVRSRMKSRNVPLSQ